MNCPGDNLRTAIAAASPGDTLLIAGTCAGNFTVTKSLTLQGSPSATIDDKGTGRPLTIAAGTTVTLTNLTVTGGNAAGVGPAGAGDVILSHNGTAMLTNTVVSGNSAPGGGGIAAGFAPAP